MVLKNQENMYKKNYEVIVKKNIIIIKGLRMFLLNYAFQYVFIKVNVNECVCVLDEW
jgi:hypothetical protein